jgi:hypothetical protein
MLSHFGILLSNQIEIVAPATCSTATTGRSGPAAQARLEAGEIAQALLSHFLWWWRVDRELCFVLVDEIGEER